MNNEYDFTPPAVVDLNTGRERTTEQVLEHGKEVVERQISSMIELSSGSGVVEKAIKENKQIANIIKNALVEGSHFGYVPGTQTKTLFQGGADVLARTYGLEIRYDLVDKTLDVPSNYLDYEYKAVVYWSGKQVAEAIASANTLEQKFKAHFWDNRKNELKAGKSIFDIKNTIQQMAQKRAMVRAIRKVLGISAEFTQDVEDGASTGMPATKEDKMTIYQDLYVYKTSEMGKNETDRKNWMKLNVLKPIVDLVCEGRGFSKWNKEDTDKITEQIQNKEYMEKLIKEALNA